MANRPAPRPPAPAATTGTTRTVFIVFGIVGAALIAALAFILGMTAVNPQQRGLEEKLVLVRQKAATCSQERDRLRAKAKREPDYRKSPAYKIQEENDRLADQNNELMTDNESLRDEKAMLEETLTELRFDLDKNSIITEEENHKLEEFERKGNMSDSLAAFIADQKLWGGVDKDELLTKLMDELKWKKQQYQKCTKDIVSAKEKLNKVKAEKTSKVEAEKKPEPVAEQKPEATKPAEFTREQLNALLAQLNKDKEDKPAAVEKKAVTKSEPTTAELMARLEAEQLKQQQKPTDAKAAETDKAAEEKRLTQLLAELRSTDKIVQKEKPVETTPEKPMVKETSQTTKFSQEDINKLLAELGNKN